LVIGILILPFDLAQGGESFDLAQDREPVERPVELFGFWNIYTLRINLLLAVLSDSIKEFVG
jgi:hypothetical protein